MYCYPCQGYAIPYLPNQPYPPYYYDMGQPLLEQPLQNQVQTQMLSPQAVPMPPSGAVIPGTGPVVEESYVENILRLNRGKMATVYMTFENNSEWNAKVFRGTIEAAGRDHLVIRDPETGERYLLLMVNLDYITFDGPIEYIAPPVPGSF